MTRGWTRMLAALSAFCAAALVPAALADGPCVLPPGAENFEKRTVTLPGGAELTLAWIEAGELEIGRSVRGVPKEPLRMATDGFWMGVCEVTQAQWESVMGSNPSYFRWEELPVECVSWEDCQEFCRRTGLRLPTGVEWRVARGAVWEHTANPWSWTDRNSRNRTHPAGRSNAGDTGLFDLDGNVCEWCADWSGAWPEASATNYAGPPGGTERVVCGGCWCGGGLFEVFMSKDHLSLPPDSRYNNVGFRVCLSPTRGE